MSGATEWIRIASTSDVAEGEALAIETMGLSLALYHVEGEWFCTDNVCTHAMAMLTEGWLDGHIIECPLHGGQFDIRTGKGVSPPIDEDLKTYPVRVEGDSVLIALPLPGR